MDTFTDWPFLSWLDWLIHYYRLSFFWLGWRTGYCMSGYATEDKRVKKGLYFNKIELSANLASVHFSFQACFWCFKKLTRGKKCEHKKTRTQRKKITNLNTLYFGHTGLQCVSRNVDACVYLLLRLLFSIHFHWKLLTCAPFSSPFKFIHSIRCAVAGIFHYAETRCFLCFNNTHAWKSFFFTFIKDDS